MLILMWFVLCIVGASLILLPLVLRRHEIIKRFSGGRLVTCPENHESAVVSIDARHAAATGLDVSPEVRLCDCTRWPERLHCDQACLAKAVQAGPFNAGEVKVERKQIYHLPIVLAAFAAWYLGIVWHSRYLFHTQWLNAIGIPYEQLKQLRSWSSPQILIGAVWLLFAYGVAWLLAVSHRKGALQGVLMSVLLCGALALTSWPGILRLPHDLLAIEASYAVLSVLAIGAIVGGLYNKLVIPSH